MNKKGIFKARGILAVMLLCGAAVFAFTQNSGEKIFLAEARMQSKIAPAEAEDSGVVLAIFEAVSRPRLEPPSEKRITQLEDFNYLTRNIFLADRNTILLERDIDVREFLEMDFTLDENADGPQVLIFHAHSREKFVDSDPADPFSGVMGLGRELAEILSRDYGLEVLHHTERFDVVNGLPMREGSYERVEPVIRRILAENPSIELVIDLHRDGIPAHLDPLVTYIDGERAAQIMFVNGLSRRFRNGEIQPVDWLPNPYQRENLAFTLNLQLAANELHPGFARRAYLLPFRYSLHMAPASILLEVGAQNNTFGEAMNSIPAVAEIIAAVVLE